MTAFATRAVHAGHDPAQHNGSVTTPIYQVSAFVRPHTRPVESAAASLAHAAGAVIAASFDVGAEVARHAGMLGCWGPGIRPG